MSKLDDEELESISKGLDDYLEAVLQVEQVYGIVQCNECRYWGRMDGYLEPNDTRFIKFICPKCNSIELVKNPEHNA